MAKSNRKKTSKSSKKTRDLAPLATRAGKVKAGGRARKGRFTP